MFETYTEMTNRWFDLANDTYRTYVKSLMWSQERAMEVTKLMMGQAERFQTEGRTLVQEYTDEAQRGQQILQNMWQEGVRNGTEAVNQFRETTSTNLTELNERMVNLQSKMEANATEATHAVTESVKANTEVATEVLTKAARAGSESIKPTATIA